MNAELYARFVAHRMAELRGWRGGSEPKDVRDDIFATMTRHDEIYSRCFAGGTDPIVAAVLIQDAEWSC